MKQVFLSLLLCLSSWTLAQPAPVKDPQASALQQHRPAKRLGLVLGGGGAKGVAHIGVLKVLERAGIPVDVITSTSMGSIIGGTYACGHSAAQLDSVVRSQDWSFVLSDRENLSHQSLHEQEKQQTYILSRAVTFRKNLSPMGGGIITGTNIASLFDLLTAPYNDSIDFNTLPIPFACVATNIVNNTEYVFHSGVLSQAMRASMAIPGVFSPVRRDSMVLIDGGMRNNFPVDVARQMGADYVIGVDVQDLPKTSADKLHSSAQILSQITDFLCMNKYEENVQNTDIFIRVNTEGYSAASFNKSAVDSLIRRGEEAAMKHWDAIVALREKLGLGNENPVEQWQADALPISTKKAYKIGFVRFLNMTPNDEKYLSRKFHLEPGDSITAEQAEIITTAIRHDLHYKTANYRLRNRAKLGDVTLLLEAGEKNDVQINLGVRFDNEEMVALQANAVVPVRTKLPMDTELTLRLGKRIMARIDWTLHVTTFFQPMVSYIYRNNDISLFEYGDKLYDMTYNQHTVKLSLLNFNVRNFNISIGANWNYYNYHSLMVNHLTMPDAYNEEDDHDKGYISYEAKVWYNSENKWYFPTSGVRFQAKYAYVTDDFIKLNGKTGLQEYSMMFRASFPVGHKLTFQPMLYGRAVISDYMPILMDNTMGGEWFDHYIEGQVPFAGVGNVEMAWEKLFATQMQLQYNLTTNNNILLRLAAGQDAPSFKDVLKHKTMLGASLSYYYTTLFGPLGGSIGYSNLTKKFYYYINLGFVF